MRENERIWGKYFWKNGEKQRETDRNREKDGEYERRKVFKGIKGNERSLS